MPNWTEGTMKVRGSPQSLMKFIETAIEANVEKHIYGKDVEYTVPDWAYIKGSRRAFTGDMSCKKSVCYISAEKDNSAIITIPIRQAWSFTPYEGAEERWINLAKEYNVDIRLQGFECGMEFYQDLEITGGEITKDKVIQYECWDWDCPMPRLGG